MSSLKSKAKGLKGTFPGLYTAIRGIYHNSQYFSSYCKSRMLRGDIPTQGDRIISVPLDRIEFGNFDESGNRSLPADDSFRGVARIEGGDWDLQKTCLADMEFYKAARGYLLDGKDIRESGYYGGNASPADKVTRGAWFTVYEQNIDEKVQRLQSLYKTLQENGYRRQSELDKGNPIDEIHVRIGRGGEILFDNSIHRLIVAKIMGIQHVPAIVTVRHKKWVQTRKQFYEFAKARAGGKMYGKLLHPDLADIPHLHECDDRVQIIEPLLADCKREKSLDIGADLGIFSHMLDRMGFQDTAVERDIELANYIRLLRDVEGRSFDVVIGDILSPEIQDRVTAHQYSVVLGLNIFHHFLKKKEWYESFQRLLGKLDMQTMVFQAHDTNEPQMQSAFLNPSAQDFVSLIIKNSCLTSAKHIATTYDDREIFLLTRD